MLRLTALAAVVAAAAAQQSPEVSASDGNLDVNLPVNGDLTATRTRRQTISVGDLADQLSTLQSTVSDMAANAAVYQGSMSMVTALLDSTVAHNQQTAVNQATNELRITAIETTVQSTMEELQDDMRSMSDHLNSELAEAQRNMSAAAIEMQEDNELQISQALRLVNDSIAQGAQQISAINTSLRSSLNSKLNAVRHVWVGVCSSHAYGSSEICHNRPEMNTMAPKFRSASNTRFAALVRGWFRIAFHNINESCNWGHTRAYINGRQLYVTYMHTSSWWWKDGFVDEVGEVLAGQQFWVHVSSGCGRNSAHAGGHQRQAYTYEGVVRSQDL